MEDKVGTVSRKYKDAADTLKWQHEGGIKFNYKKRLSKWSLNANSINKPKGFNAYEARNKNYLTIKKAVYTPILVYKGTKQ